MQAGGFRVGDVGGLRASGVQGLGSGRLRV